MSTDEWPLLRLRVTADADLGALARVLERFQNSNVLPRKLTAEMCISGVVHVEVDICGIAVETIHRIAAKLEEVPCIRSARWHRV